MKEKWDEKIIERETVLLCVAWIKLSRFPPAARARQLEQEIQDKYHILNEGAISKSMPDPHSDLNCLATTAIWNFHIPLNWFSLLITQVLLYPDAASDQRHSEYKNVTVAPHKGVQATIETTLHISNMKSFMSFQKDLELGVSNQTSPVG